MSTSPITAPSVSVVIGAYNAAATLPATVDSVLAQTFADLECIVVDDASQDGTGEWVRARAEQDPRLRLITLDTNGGLTRALVCGVNEARGNWLARIDAGDTWHPEKLSRQFAYSAAHAEVGLVGCWSEDTNLQTGATELRQKPVEHDAITTMLWHACPFIHSTILARLDLVRICGNYDPDFRYAQDYDLYFRLLKITQGHNLPEVFCGRTTHDAAALSYAHWKDQLRCSLAIRFKYYRRYRRPHRDYLMLLPDMAKLLLPVSSKRLKQRLKDPKHAR